MSSLAFVGSLVLLTGVAAWLLQFSVLVYLIYLRLAQLVWGGVKTGCYRLCEEYYSLFDYLRKQLLFSSHTCGFVFDMLRL